MAPPAPEWLTTDAVVDAGGMEGDPNVANVAAQKPTVRARAGAGLVAAVAAIAVVVVDPRQWHAGLRTVLAAKRRPAVQMGV